MWRLLNGLLPFADILQDFGFLQPSKCPFCHNSDSLHHGFVDCIQARSLWLFFSLICCSCLSLFSTIYGTSWSFVGWTGMIISIWCCVCSLQPCVGCCGVHAILRFMRIKMFRLRVFGIRFFIIFIVIRNLGLFLCFPLLGIS